MPRGVCAVLLIACLVHVSGCATVLSGPKQPVAFSSEPSGAVVTLNGMPLGRTPFTINLPRWRDGVIYFEREGYRPEARMLGRSFNWVTLVNIPWFFVGVVPGFIGVGIDISTGAIFELTPDRLHAVLTADDRPLDAPEPENERPQPDQEEAEEVEVEDRGGDD